MWTFVKWRWTLQIQFYYLETYRPLIISRHEVLMLVGFLSSHCEISLTTVAGTEWRECGQRECLWGAALSHYNKLFALCDSRQLETQHQLPGHSRARETETGRARTRKTLREKFRSRLCGQYTNQTHYPVDLLSWMLSNAINQSEAQM